MSEILDGFSNAMWENGHMNLKCPECKAVMWLEEGEMSTQIMLMRYATHHVDECKTCRSVHDAWEKNGVFDV